MGARNKLNGANLRGALVIAGVIGVASGSWTIFAVSALGLLAASLISGDIRLGGGRK